MREKLEMVMGQVLEMKAAITNKHTKEIVKEYYLLLTAKVGIADSDPLRKKLLVMPSFTTLELSDTR